MTVFQSPLLILLLVISMKLQFKKLHPNALIPQRAKDGDAGYDLFALEPTKINPFERKLIPTGISMAIPYGFYGRVAPRSGSALKHGIDVMAGVIDGSYRGDVGVVLINLNMLPSLSEALGRNHNAMVISSLFGAAGQFEIRRGDKIAQIIIEHCADVEFEEVESLPESERGAGGFGSTDKL